MLKSLTDLTVIESAIIIDSSEPTPCLRRHQQSRDQRARVHTQCERRQCEGRAVETESRGIVVVGVAIVTAIVIVIASRILIASVIVKRRMGLIGRI